METDEEKRKAEFHKMREDYYEAFIFKVKCAFNDCNCTNGEEFEQELRRICINYGIDWKILSPYYNKGGVK